MEIHLSIDDVIFSLQELSVKKYKSIFFHPFYATLRRLHKRYGCVFSLYIFAQKDGFSIEDMSCQYREEFLDNSNWIRFGYHGESAEKTSDLLYQYTRINKAVERFSGQSITCETLRLHGFKATHDEIAILKANGVKCLLCADDNRVSYDLPGKEDKKLKTDGYVNIDGMLYYRSNIRLENYSIRNLRNFNLKGATLVVFTHEWCFYSFRKPLTELKANVLLRKLSQISTRYVFDLRKME